MALSQSQVRRLLAVIKAHVQWLSYSVASDHSLTEEDKQQFKKYNLPDVELDLVKNGYALGILRMLLKKSEYNNLSFEQLLAHLDDKRTFLEQAAIEQAITSAGNLLKGLAQDIADDAFTAVNKTSNQIVNQAMVKDAVRDQVAFSIMKREGYMKVASDLAHNLGANWKRDWRRVAETELVRAKVSGQVQALVNRKDIYAHSEGVESDVSVMPSHDTCKDCAHLYLGKDGNPKIFKLSWLIAQGSNGDDDVSHRKVEGRHVHWKITLPPCHPRCYDKETSLYTKRGWIKFPEVVKEDLVLSLHPDTKDLEWVSITDLFKFHSEKMMHFKNKTFDLMVTDDHMMVYQTKWDRDCGRTGLRFIEAKDLPKDSYIYRSSEWVGEVLEGIDTFGMTLENYCIFMGYWLSEGHLGRKEIMINQWKEETRPVMFKALSEMGFKVCNLQQKGIYIKLQNEHHDRLFQYLESFGYSYKKFVPEEIKSLPKSYIELFLNSYTLGDGHTRKNMKSFKGGTFSPEVSITTASIRMRDDLGELLIKVGKRPSFFEEPERWVEHKNGTYLSRPTYKVIACTNQYAATANMTRDLVDYDDDVYCVRLEKNHTLFVQRSGKVCWSGNCGCRLVYVPVGYGWRDGKLTLTDEKAYKQSLTKSMEVLQKAKEYTPFSPTAKPMGPATVKPETPHMPSSPGVDSPARTVTGKAPKTPSAPTAGASTVKTPKLGAKTPDPNEGGNTDNPMVDCPLGVQGCEALGGTGKHHQNSKMLQEHQQIASQRGASSPDQEQQPQEDQQQKLQQTLQIAANWKPTEHPSSVLRDHLEKGKVALAVDIGEGATKPQMFTIDGNGKGVFKAERGKKIDANEMSRDEVLALPRVESIGLIAENTFHKREVGTYSHAASYGSDLHPMTVYRNHEGKDGSIMSEVKDQVTIHKAKQKLEPGELKSFCKGENENAFNYAAFAIEKSDNPEKTKDQIMRSIVHDAMINNTDRHAGNLMQNMQCIDNANTFARGLKMHTNYMFAGMKSAGYKVSIPKDLHTKMEARSFGDEIRSIGSHVSKQETAETFLRTKYLVHLQNTEGHIDYDHFMSFDELPGGAKPTPSEYDTRMFGAKKCYDVQDAGTPDDRFNKFKDNYLKEMENPNHPHHKELNDVKEALATPDRTDETPLTRWQRGNAARQIQAQTYVETYQSANEKHKNDIRARIEKQNKWKEESEKKAKEQEESEKKAKEQFQHAKTGNLATAKTALAETGTKTAQSEDVLAKTRR